MANKIYIGDVGTKLVGDCEEDVTAATVTKIKYRKPDGTKGEWAATIEDDTKLFYVTLADDINLSGTWKLQTYIETPTWKGHGETFEMEVYDLFM